MKKQCLMILTSILISFLNFNYVHAKKSDVYLGFGTGIFVPESIKVKLKTPDNVVYANKMNPKINFIVGYYIHDYIALDLNVEYGPERQFYNSQGDLMTSLFSFFLDIVPQYNFDGHHVIFTRIGLGFTNNMVFIQGNDFTNHNAGIAYHIALGYEYKINDMHGFAFSYDFYHSPLANWGNTGEGQFMYNIEELYFSTISINYKFYLG